MSQVPENIRVYISSYSVTVIMKGTWVSDSKCFLLTNLSLFLEPPSPLPYQLGNVGWADGFWLEEALSVPEGQGKNNHREARQRKVPF